jgi:hypothetical protein
MLNVTRFDNQALVHRMMSRHSIDRFPIFCSALLYASFLAVLAVVTVFAGPAASPLLLGSLVATALLVAAFGYGAASGQTVAHVALVLLGLGPLISFGIQAADAGVGAWTTLGLLVRGLAAAGGIALAGLALRQILTGEPSRGAAPFA